MFKFKDLFTIDIRSLAVFRIGLGILILCDLFVRFDDLKAHYTDEGILPRTVVIEEIIGFYQWSLHFINGTAFFQTILFIIAAGFAVMLLVGYRTRLVTVASWVMMHSLHVRNIKVLNGGDAFFGLLLFWSMFLPLGASCSVDRALNNSQQQPPQRIISMGSAILLFQICFLYWHAVLVKVDHVWTHDFTAIYYTLSIDQFATPLGVYLLNFPELLKILTLLTVVLEYGGPLVVFVPYFTATIRTIMVGVFVFFHVAGMGLTMELGLFPYICAVAWLVFLPSCFWDKISQRLIRLKGFHKFLARQREKFRSFFLFLTPRPIKTTTPGYINFILGIFFIFIVLLNVYWINYDYLKDKYIFERDVNKVAYFFRINQRWTMFAPHPSTVGGWHVIEAKLVNGKTIDLFNNGKLISWKKPKNVSAIYKNQRWSKYMMEFDREKNRGIRRYYGRYLIQTWNSTHASNEQIEFLTIYFMEEKTSLVNRTPEPKKILLWRNKKGFQ